MLANDLLIDGFERVKRVVYATLKDLSGEDLAFRPGPKANSIAWLIWHLTHVQDDHIADAAHAQQVWLADGWVKKFNLPFDKMATGWSQNSQEVGQVKAGGELLLGYYDAVHEQTIKFIKSPKQDDYKKVIDRNWICRSRWLCGLSAY